MRHGKRLAKLSRPTDQRMAILESLCRELLIRKRLTTTHRRARAAQKIIDKLIVLSRKGGLSAQRLALKILPDKTVIKNMFLESKTLFQNRTSGFTRIVKCGRRRGDASTRVIWELVEKTES